MNKILKLGTSILLALTPLFANAAGWTTYSNFQQLTDAEPKGSELFITAKGGMLITNTISGTKRFFTTENSALPSNQVEQVAKSASDDIWIGTYDNGLARWTGVDFVPTAYPTNFGLLYAMKFGHDGKLYLQSSNGAYQFNTSTKTFKKFNATSTNVWLYDAWSFDFNAAGNIVVFTGTNCLTVDINTLQVVDSFDTLTTPLVFGCSPATSTILATDMNNNLLTVGNFSVAFLHRDGTSTDAISGLPVFSDIKTMRGADNNIYALLDNNSIYQLSDTTWHFVYDLGVGNYAKNMFYENGSTAYFNTYEFDEKAIDICDHSLVTTHQKIDARKYVFESNTMSSIYRDNHNDIFTVTGNKIYKYDRINDTWLYYLTAPAIFGVVNDVRFINGQIYAINYGNLIEFYNGSTWTQVPLAPGASAPYVFSYDVSSSGLIYFCNTEGLFKYEAGATTKLIGLPSGSTDWFTAVKYDESRNLLWLAKSDKIIEYDFATQTVYNSDNVAVLPTAMRIYDIQINPADNTVWFGSMANQAIKYDGTNFSLITTPNPEDAFVYQILFKNDGTIIFRNSGGNGGFFTLKDGTWKRFHTDVMSDMLSSFVYDMEIDDDGYYWLIFNTDLGVAKYLDVNASVQSVDVASNNLFVYPNPANDKVYVAADSKPLSLYSVDGVLQQTKDVTENGVTKLNTQALNNGIYFLKAGDKTTKIIIQH